MVHCGCCRSWCSREKCSYFLVGLIGICVVSVAVIPFPLLTIANNRSQKEKNKKEHEFLMFCISELSDVIYPISVDLFGLAGFLYGQPLKSPPYNGSLAERIENQYFNDFDFVSQSILSQTNTSEILFVAPGAVITQTYPSEPLLFHEDFMHSQTQYSFAFSPFRASYVKQIQSHIDFDDRFGSWVILQTMMVFNGSMENSSFWGMAGVLTNLIELIEKTGIEEKARKEAMSFLIAAVPSSSHKLVPIYSSDSFSSNASAGELIDFILRSESAALTHNGNTLFNIFIAESAAKETHVSPFVIIAIVFVVIIIVSTLLFSFVLVPPKQFNRFHNAPRSPPFAVFMIGPQQDKDLWSLTLEQLSASLEKAERKYHAYQIPQVQPYTTYTYTLGTVDDAVQMAFSVMKDIHQQSIDSDLVSLLGEDARFIFSCAIHWCTDAEVSLNAREEFVVYGGRDIEYTKEIYKEAVGNAVTISARAQEHLSCVPPSDTFVFSLSCRHQTEGFSEKAYYVVDTKNDIIYSAFRYAQRLSSEVSRPAHPGFPIFQDQFRRNENAYEKRASCGQVTSSTPVSDESSCEDSPRMDKNFQRYLISRLPTHELKAKEGLRGNQYLRSISPTLQFEPEQQHQKEEENTDCSVNETIHNPLILYKPIGYSPAAQFITIPSAFPPDTSGYSDLPPLGAGASELTCRSGSLSGDGSALYLDSSSVPPWLDRALRRIYDRHSLYLRPFPWPVIKIIIYYFYFGYALLFQPLAPRERDNIAQCLATAFGVPQAGLYEHLAVRCAMDFMTSNDNSQFGHL